MNLHFHRLKHFTLISGLHNHHLFRLGDLGLSPWILNCIFKGRRYEVHISDTCTSLAHFSSTKLCCCISISCSYVCEKKSIFKKQSCRSGNYMYEKFFRCVALIIYQNFHTKTILTSALSNNVKGKF